jgi:chromate transporter
MLQPALPRLLYTYFRIGAVTFGGGNPTMAALQSELVTRYRWLSAESYGVVYALARITPGTNLLAFCAGTAWYLLGWRGAVAAVAAVTLPAAAAVVLLTLGYQSWRANPWALAAIGGTLAAAVGMMGAAAWELIRPQLRAGRWLQCVVMVPLSVLLSFRFAVSPILVLLLAALAGLLWRPPDQG